MTRSKSSGAFVENLESRSLLSASLNQTVNDYNTFANDLTNFSFYLSLAVNAVPAGVSGSNAVRTAMTNLENTITNRVAKLQTDMSNVLNGPAQGQQAAIVQLAADGAKFRTKLKTEWKAEQKPLTNAFNQALITDPVFASEVPTVVTSWNSVKADYKTLKADLT